MSGDVDQELRDLLDAGARERPRRDARSAVVAGAARRLLWRTLKPWLLVGGLGVAAVVAAGLWTVAPAASTEPPPGHMGPDPFCLTQPSAAAESEAPTEPEAAAVPEPAPAPRVRAAADERTRRVPRARVEAPPPSPPEPIADPSTLQEEVALLARAHRALERHDPDGALEALDEHRARFPGGVLASDRDAATWVARCAIDPAARPRGLAHAASHPRAPLAARIRAACTDGEIP